MIAYVGIQIQMPSKFMAPLEFRVLKFFCTFQSRKSQRAHDKLSKSSKKLKRILKNSK